MIAFIVYGIDKGLSKTEARRIPEKTLILLAAFGGAPGAALGMNIFHHKTKKKKFLLVYVFLVLWTAICAVLAYLNRNDIAAWAKSTNIFNMIVINAVF